MKRRSLTNSLIFLATILFIVGGTILMIRYAKGYRANLDGTVKGTGLLAANSFPTGAQVFINDELTSATDTTLNLDPGEYQVSVKKDGYHGWSKKLYIEKELVTQTNATLFPMSPTLEPLTFTGGFNPIPSPDGNELAYVVASASAETKNGLYIQELSSTPITLTRSARQIARTTINHDYTRATYTWSPTGSQILVSFDDNDNLLLDSDRFNDPSTLRDITAQLPSLMREWEQELATQERTHFNKITEAFKEIVLTSPGTSKIGNIYFSPDNEKILYQAMESFTLPQGLGAKLPSSSTQLESRDLITGSWYVYDLKEDKNFLIAVGAEPSPSPIPSSTPSSRTRALPSPTPLPVFTLRKLLLSEVGSPTPAELGLPAQAGTTPSAYTSLQNGFTTSQSVSLFNAEYSPIHVTRIQWFPDSYHLILTSDTAIDIVEYDNTNRTTIYAGPFDPSFVYPWPDSSKLVTRIQFSPDTVPNLYTIKLK